MNIDNIKEFLHSISRKEIAFANRAGNLFKGFIKAIKDKNAVAYIRSNPWIITMLTAPISLICAVALIVCPSTNTFSASLNASAKKAQKTKTVEIYDVKFILPEYCVVQENTDATSIYFQDPEIKGVYDAIGVSCIYYSDLPDEQIDGLLFATIQDIASKIDANAEYVVESYDVDGFIGYHSYGDSEDNIYHYEFYLFRINERAMMFLNYTNLNNQGEPRSDLVKNIVDSIIIDENKHTETTTTTTGKTGGKESSDKPAFTNKYGTPTTKCAHKGCNNYIARTGDTNCCEKHSAKCLNCGKYIDEDAVYCMDCLSNAASKTTKKTSYSASDTSNRCQFKDSNGNKTCTNPAMPGSTLCEEHYKYLDEIYHSFAD